MKKTLIDQTFEFDEMIEFIKNRPMEYKFTGGNIEIPLTTWIDKKTEGIEPPKIMILPGVYLKMMHLVLKSDKEIAWHGIVEHHPALNTYLISDILVYPQIIAHTTVDSDETEYPKWIMKNHKILNTIRMQGHSHVNMNVSPSGTDTSYYNELVAQVEDYYIFMIINKKQDLYVRFYDRPNNIMYEGLPIVIKDGQEEFNLDTFYEDSKKMFTLKPTTNVYYPGAVHTAPAKDIKTKSVPKKDATVEKKNETQAAQEELDKIYEAYHQGFEDAMITHGFDFDDYDF